jgi:hypothetical protein
MERMMNRQILEQNVYYYEDGVQNFNELMSTIRELEELENSNGMQFWDDWMSCSGQMYHYGDNKGFDPELIEKMDQPYKDMYSFIHKTLMDSFISVCKDYALERGDSDEPRLFPVLNLKRYHVGKNMGAHFDQLEGDTTLRYSLVMYLSDDHEGGELSFKLSDYDHMIGGVHEDYEIAKANNDFDFGIKPKAGSIIIFPSSAPYHHTAHIIKQGFKYMVPSHWIHNDMQMSAGPAPLKMGQVND